MTGKEMVDLYRSRGWIIDRVKGSHYVLKNNGEIEVIPVHGSKDLAKGLEIKLKRRLGL